MIALMNLSDNELFIYIHIIRQDIGFDTISLLNLSRRGETKIYTHSNLKYTKAKITPLIRLIISHR